VESEEKVVTSYSFLNTLKVSIFQFDKYYEIMQQRTRKMLVFFFEIAVLVAIILTATVALRLNSAYDYVYNFVKDNLPDFTISKDGFKMDIDEPLIYNNSEFFNSVVVFDNNNDNKKYLDEANKSNAVYLIITKESLVLKIPEMITTEYKFSEIFKEKTATTNTVNATENAVENTTENTTEKVVENATENSVAENATTETNSTKEINKEYIIKTFNQDAIGETIRSLALYLFLLLFLSLMLISIINIAALSILGFIFTKILRLPVKFRSAFNMAIAASVLPTVLLCVYMVINICTGFVIAKFDILYAIISYIYMGAAILILRSNLLKTKSRKEEKVAAETGNSNVEITVDSSEVDSEEDDEEDKDNSEE